MKNGDGEDNLVGSRGAPQVSLGPGGSALAWSVNSSIHALVLCLDVLHTAR